jgi:hypothetical protein
MLRRAARAPKRDERAPASRARVRGTTRKTTTPSDASPEDVGRHSPSPDPNVPPAPSPLDPRHRLALLVAFALPLACALALDGEAARQDVSAWTDATVRHFPRYARDPAWRRAVAALAVERMCYTVLWLFPRTITRVCAECRVQPVNAIVAVFAANKVIQLAAFLGFRLLVAAAAERDDDAPRRDARLGGCPFASSDGALALALAPWRAIVGVALCALGQTLNLATYAAIGKDGVYYGCRYGREVPWCERFPFTASRHPQYVGAATTAWGLCVLAATDEAARRGWFGLAVVQSAYYAYMARVEARW